MLLILVTIGILVILVIQVRLVCIVGVGGIFIVSLSILVGLV